MNQCVCISNSFEGYHIVYTNVFEFGYVYISVVYYAELVSECLKCCADDSEDSMSKV